MKYFSTRIKFFLSSKILTIVAEISLSLVIGAPCVRETERAPPLTSDTLRVNMSGPNYTCVQCHIMLWPSHMYSRCVQKPQACANICQKRGESDLMMLDLTITPLPEITTRQLPQHQAWLSIHRWLGSKLEVGV